MELPELCAVLRAELELPTELRAKALIDAACAVIGCAFQGTLVERAQRCVSLLDAAAQAGAVSCEAAAACAETAGRRRRRRKKATSKTTGTSAASLEEESEEEPASPTLCAAVVVPARRRLCKRGATVSGRKMCISVFSRSDDAVEVDALLVESTRRLALSLPRARVTAALGRAVPCASAPARHQHDFCEALLAALRLDAHEELSVLEPPSSEDAQPTHPPVAETTTPLPVPPLTQRGAPVASRALPPPRVPDTPPPRVPDAPALQHLVPEIERCCAAFDCDKFWRPLAQPLHVALAELAAAEVARTSGDAAAAETARSRALRSVEATCAELLQQRTHGIEEFTAQYVRLLKVKHALVSAPKATLQQRAQKAREPPEPVEPHATAAAVEQQPDRAEAALSTQRRDPATKTTVVAQTSLVAAAKKPTQPTPHEKTARLSIEEIVAEGLLFAAPFTGTA